MQKAHTPSCDLAQRAVTWPHAGARDPVTSADPGAAEKDYTCTVYT